MTEEEYDLRHGEPLDQAIRLFQMSFKQTIMAKIADQPELWKDEVKKKLLG
jgi:hypothetical protein